MPEAEVNPPVLNVGFGDPGNNGVTESKGAYIDRGADTQLRCAKESPHIYNFFQISGWQTSLLQDCHNSWQEAQLW